jgi:methyl-accepting chemotaxis protein
MPDQPLPNPAEQLGAIVSQLYALAGNSTVPADQRQALFLKAHNLRGDLNELVALQFTNETANYQSVMASLDKVTAALNQAEQSIQNITDVVNGAAQLASSIDNLLQEAAQIAAKAG